jgi:Amidase
MVEDMPPNPNAPDHVTGGAGAGCASAVAAGDVHFALGVDHLAGIRVSQPGRYVAPSMGHAVRLSVHLQWCTHAISMLQFTGCNMATPAVQLASSLQSNCYAFLQVAAACCGMYGFRASAGAVSQQGVVSVTPSLEAIAWTARDMATLQQVGAALQLPGGPRHPSCTAGVCYHRAF